jgi:peptide/nickel transport system substrate-binding protein
MLSMAFTLIRRSGRAIACILLSLVLVLTVQACNVQRYRSSVAAVPQLVLSTIQDPKTFNYANNQEFPNIFLFCYRGLVRINYSTKTMEPELAEKWEISPDKKRIVFTLRQGLKWSDGQPLTADDVVFSFQDVIFNEKIPSDDKDFLKIGEKGEFPLVQKLDQRRVEFVLPEPFAPLLEALSGPPSNAVIYPKHALETAVKTLDKDGNPLFTSMWGTDTDPRKIVVNGPYQMESYRQGERLIYRRNPYYWQKDATGNPLPYIERIVWNIVDSTDTQLLAFRSGDLDAIGDVRPLRAEYFSLLKKEEDRGQFKVLSGGPWAGELFLLFNLNQAKDKAGKPLVDPIKSQWFNKLEFRQAIAYALDRPSMINNVMRGISEPQNSPLSPQSPFYLKPEEGLKVYDYNLEKSKQLLQQAGFKYNANQQLVDAQGNRVRFTFNTNAGNKMREALGAQIKTDLAKLGIQVDFNPLAFNTLVTKLNTTRDWECAMIGFTGGLDPHTGSNLWTSRGGSHLFNLAPKTAADAIQGWAASPWELEIDRLFRTGAQELDPAKRRVIYAQFQTLVQEQLPVIHLLQEVALMAVRDRISGVAYSGLPNWGLWNVQELGLEEN